MFVGAVIVHNEVKGSFPWKLAVQASQKSQELLMAMALVALTDNAATQDFQSREKVVVPLRLYRASSSRNGLS